MRDTSFYDKAEQETAGKALEGLEKGTAQAMTANS
jgi:hypothetical protein